MDTKAILTFLVVATFTILLLVFRNKISQKSNQYFQKLSGWLPRGFMRWLSAWQSYFKKNTRRLFLYLWDLLESCSVLILLFSATFGALYLYHSRGKPFSLEAWGALGALSAMLGLIALGAIFLVFFVVFATFFVLSLHSKGRKIADRIFKFTQPTELEALKIRVGKIEGRLTSIEERVEKVEGSLASINTKLGNIEATLERVAKSANHAEHHPKQKPQRKGRQSGH